MEARVVEEGCGRRVGAPGGRRWRREAARIQPELELELSAAMATAWAWRLTWAAARAGEGLNQPREARVSSRACFIGA